jgi:hypothetical protein
VDRWDVLLSPNPYSRYRDELRGFYFDLDHRDAYVRFRERFCPHDDGRATERFLQRFFGDTSIVG